MDEILEIERQLGEVAGIASLQYGGEEPVYINKEDIEYEVFPEPEVIEAPVKVDGEGDDEQPPAPVDEEEDANKPPPFDPKIFDWTVTNKKAWNLPQLFLQLKGKAGISEVKQAEDYSSIQYDAISQGIDAYLKNLTRGEWAHERKKPYLQLIFRDNN